MGKTSSKGPFSIATVRLPECKGTSPKSPDHSGLGIILICPDTCEGIDQSEIEANLRSLPVFLRLGACPGGDAWGVMGVGSWLHGRKKPVVCFKKDTP